MGHAFDMSSVKIGSSTEKKQLQLGAWLGEFAFCVEVLVAKAAYCRYGQSASNCGLSVKENICYSPPGAAPHHTRQETLFLSARAAGDSTLFLYRVALLLLTGPRDQYDQCDCFSRDQIRSFLQHATSRDDG
jgi:hypothetical protein